ncbi:hypothetical protein RIEGSTA812A_PEG_625 [invertebrate metagenome]|uniref:SAM-dependent chlorinase/fluorinase n=1 Tax=invertebrate metagenome TaxID=1711999 RepID=A0A484HBI6_9ZZZZ
MIILFTDFGLAGPYIGQVLAVLYCNAPGIPVVNLQADAPTSDPLSAAYLLAAYVPAFPTGSVFLCVVDPGVGSARLPLVVLADSTWFVAPDNGLLELVMRRAAVVQASVITWQPSQLSASFHGRDLFAPIAARLARGQDVPGQIVMSRQSLSRPDWPDDLPAIVYIDKFGNGVTGLRAAAVDRSAILGCHCHNNTYRLRWARTFSAVPVGVAFWYENANGLVEIAVNQGRAVDQLGLTIGTHVSRSA